MLAAGCSRCAEQPPRPPAAAAPGTAPAASGALGGFVKDLEGHPVAGAEIHVFALAAHAAASRTGRSDRRGAFRVGGLDPGPHQVVIAAARHGSVDRTVRIEGGREELLSVALAPAVVLAGAVRSSAAGAPLSGARVTVLGSTGAPLADLVADEEGRFRSAGLAAGRYRLVVSAPRHLAEEQPLTLPGEPLRLRLRRLHVVAGRVVLGAAGGDAGAGIAVRLVGGGPWPTRTVSATEKGAFRFEVPAGSYELVAFSAAPPWRASPILGGVEAGGRPERAPELLLRLAPAYLIEGRVLSADGQPIAGARVAAVPTVPSGFRLRARTPDDGRFRIGPLVAGEYWTETWFPGLLPDLGRSVRLPRREPLTITLDAGKTLSGVVVDSAGQAVGGAVVRAQPRTAGGPTFAGAGELGVVPGPIPPIPPPGEAAFGEALAAVALWTTVSTSDGGFRLAGLPAAPLRVIADHAEHGEAQSGWLEAGSSGVRLVLAAGAGLEARVTTSGGSPLADVKVVAEWERRRRQTTSDHLGRFQIVGAAGRVALRLEREGYLPVSAELELAEGARVARSFVLESASGELRGQVLDHRGLPVAGATVDATAGGRSTIRLAATADRGGRFALPGLGGRACRLRASRDGFAPAELRVAAHEHYVQLRLDPLQRIEGVVRSRQLGTPLTAFSVRVDDGPQKPVRDRGGEFRVDAAPGARRVTVSAAGHAARTETVQVPTETQLPLRATFELDAAGVIEGEVQDHQGRAVGGALVSTSGASGRTDAEGRFRLEAVPEGGQPLTVVAADGRRLETTAVVRAGETTGPLRLMLPPR